MTAQQETRFHCDRCQAEETMPLDNKPIYQRVPEGWLALMINGADHKHLCADCAITFSNFMAHATLVA